MAPDHASAVQSVVVCVCGMQISAIKHENVNQFVGLCILAPNVAIVMAYAQKGCLRDVLQNENVKINIEFLHSFLTDIAAVCIVFYSVDTVITH